MAWLENSSPKEMGSGRSFYYYAYGSWDLTKTILLTKPLKGVEKNKSIASVYNFSTKKNELRSYDGFGSYDFADNVLFIKHLYVFIKQTELFTSRESKFPGIFISKSEDLVNA